MKINFTVGRAELLLEAQRLDGKRKRRRSLSQCTLTPLPNPTMPLGFSPAETISQILLNLPKLGGNLPKIQAGNPDKSSKTGTGPGSGGTKSPGNCYEGTPPSGTTHGTSAGFCNICQKFVSNRTNHKYVHSQVNISACFLILVLFDFTKKICFEHSSTDFRFCDYWLQCPFTVSCCDDIPFIR